MRIDELPPFTLHVAELMRFDPQVRIGLGARNGLLMAAEVEVTGSDDRVVRWVQHQWDALWHGSAHQLLRAKLYGFLPFEVVYRRAGGGQFARPDRSRAAHRSSPRAMCGCSCAATRSWGLSTRRRAPRDLDAGEARQGSHQGSPPGSREAYDRPPRPAALVCTFDAECANPYGCALLARAYPAWFEKWMPGGAKRTLRLRMVKDAYIGDIFWYPANQHVQLPDGTQITWRDLAREIVESRASGGAMTLPLIRDSLGNKLLDYTPPQGVPRPHANLPLEDATWTWKSGRPWKCRRKSSRRPAQRQRLQRPLDSLRRRPLAPCIRSWSS